ncbi:hypothetical protein D3C72_2117840 [compost metagenome]
MLVGNMMMPDPIMLTVTRVVSPMSVIFLPEPAIPAPDVVIHGLLGIGHLCADRRAGRVVQWLFCVSPGWHDHCAVAVAGNLGVAASILVHVGTRFPEALPCVVY